MESLTLLRKHLAMSGINIHHSPENPCRFNLKNSTVIILVHCYMASFVKLIEEIKTFEEYLDAVYKLTFGIIFAISYIIIVWKTSDLLRFIDSLEDTIAKSK